MMLSYGEHKFVDLLDLGVGRVLQVDIDGGATLWVATLSGTKFSDNSATGIMMHGKWRDLGVFAHHNPFEVTAMRIIRRFDDWMLIREAANCLLTIKKLTVLQPSR